MIAVRLGTAASWMRKSIPNWAATSEANVSRNASSSTVERWNTTRMKKRPPSGSVEYWSDWTMFAPLRASSDETAATIPGPSGHVTSRWYMASVADGGGGELGDERVGVEALQRE